MRYGGQGGLEAEAREAWSAARGDPLSAEAGEARGELARELLLPPPLLDFGSQRLLLKLMRGRVRLCLGLGLRAAVRLRGAECLRCRGHRRCQRQRLESGHSGLSSF